VKPGNEASHTPTHTSDSAFYDSQWSENEVGPSTVCILSSPEMPPTHHCVCSFRVDTITSSVHVWREESEKVKIAKSVATSGAGKQVLAHDQAVGRKESYDLLQCQHCSVVTCNC